ncbi:unnamed protein product [Rotaria sordida]|uniref:Uncharacterized protein n=1 Tax=Rotaria sordida TaxID=392033 RepID=A0A815CX07_9BILA|nr:unnamed protein product [Rotaria sordida]
MPAQREARIRRSRKVFSPSDNFIRPTHYLLYFDSTDSYSIVLFSSIHDIINKTATLNIRGSFETCEEEQEKRTRESQQTSSNGKDEAVIDGEDEDVDMPPSSQQEGLIKTFSLSNFQQKRRITDRDYSLWDEENDDDDINEKTNNQFDDLSRPTGPSDFDKNSITTKKKKKKRKQNQATGKSFKRQRTSNNYEDIEQINALIDPIIINEKNTKATHFSTESMRQPMWC